MGEWICASCGTEHEENDPPCRKCGGERFAKLAPKENDGIGSMADMEWACTECGRIHQRNNPPCNDCGAMRFERVEADADTDQDSRPFSTPSESSSSTSSSRNWSPPKSDDSGSQTLYYAGVVLGVIGVVTLPFFFFLIALPESIAKMRGTTTQKYFPQGARDNPAVSGSMLVMGWFGNFLILMFVLGVLLGLLLVFL